MKIENVPFTVVNWNEVVPKEFSGETGKAYWKIF